MNERQRKKEEGGDGSLIGEELTLNNSIQLGVYREKGK